MNIFFGKHFAKRQTTPAGTQRHSTGLARAHLQQITDALHGRQTGRVERVSTGRCSGEPRCSGSSPVILFRYEMTPHLRECSAALSMSTFSLISGAPRCRYAWSTQPNQRALTQMHRGQAAATQHAARAVGRRYLLSDQNAPESQAGWAGRHQSH